MVIQIVSGEATCGTVEPYAGRVSRLAIIRRLRREARMGRWAHALIDGMVCTVADLQSGMVLE